MTKKRDDVDDDDDDSDFDATMIFVSSSRYFFSPVFTTSHLERKKDIALKMKWFSFKNFAQQVFMFP